MPVQKNCVPSVAMKEGMPTLAMRRPFTSPTSMPDAIAAITASQPSPYSLKRIAKTKPEKAMTEGKERSISPAPMTKVRPRASRISGGSVVRKVVYMFGARKAEGACHMKNDRSSRNTTMIGSPSMREAIGRFRGSAIVPVLNSCAAGRSGIR